MSGFRPFYCKGDSKESNGAICVSLPSFAFDSCDFFPFRINGKIICELVSWKSWYSRHWVKPLGLPSLIVLRLFRSFRHLKFSWRDFSASQGRNSSVHFHVLIYLKSCSACGRLQNLHEYGLGAYKPIASESITVFAVSVLGESSCTLLNPWILLPQGSI